MKRLNYKYTPAVCCKNTPRTSKRQVE